LFGLVVQWVFVAMSVFPASVVRASRAALALTVLLTGLLTSVPARTALAQQVSCAAPERIRDSEDNRQVRAGLTALVKAVAACQTAGDWETMSRLVSQKYLGQVYGGGPSMSRAIFIELAKSFPPTRVRFRDFEDFRLGDGEAIASVKLIVGNQLTLDRMTFVESNTDGAWLIDSAAARSVDPPRNHDEVRVTIQDNRYDPAALTAEGANIEIVATNEDDVDHEVLVLRLDEGIDASVLLTSTGPGLPPGVHVLGQVTVPAGDRESLVLVTMRPGRFVLVDLLPNSLGVPHLALGMEGTLTVTK
jgi:hypothetical protein